MTSRLQFSGRTSRLLPPAVVLVSLFSAACMFSDGGGGGITKHSDPAPYVSPYSVSDLVGTYAGVHYYSEPPHTVSLMDTLTVSIDAHGHLTGIVHNTGDTLWAHLQKAIHQLNEHGLQISAKYPNLEGCRDFLGTGVYKGQDCIWTVKVSEPIFMSYLAFSISTTGLYWRHSFHLDRVSP